MFRRVHHDDGGVHLDDLGVGVQGGEVDPVGGREGLPVLVRRANVVMLAGRFRRAFFAAMVRAARTFSRMLLYFSRRHDKVGRRHPMLVRPGDLFPIAVATTMVPALVGRAATAGIVLAGKGLRAVFADARHDRHAGTSHQK